MKTKIGKKAQSALSSRGGSTIVAVLVAMVFIGIVTASMLKNTSGQSSVSAGHGTSMTMASTANSGILATEYYLGKMSKASAEKMLNDYIAKKSTSDILGTAAKKEQLSSNQYFYSTIAGINTATKKMVVNVASGREQKGRDMKKIRAIYSVNLKSGTYDSESAIYMKGDLKDGNNGMHVKKGKAKFEGSIRLQNKKTVFDHEVSFRGDVEISAATKFNKDVLIDGNLTIGSLNGTDSAIFNGDTYIGSDPNGSNPKTGLKHKLTLGNVSFKGKTRFDNSGSEIEFMNPGSNTVFKDDLYIDGALKNFTSNINVEGDVYFEDDIKSASNWSGSGKFVSTETGKKFHYNSKYTTITDADVKSKATNFATATYTPGTQVVNLETIKQKTGYDAPEPKIDISKIPVPAGGRLKARGNITASSSSDEFSLSKLESLYATEMAKPNNPNVYNGHLVIEIADNLKFNTSGMTFGGKVIYIVTGNNTTIGNTGPGYFYGNSGEGSTLMYLGPSNPGATGPSFERFGSDGDFRGLIYVDEKNNSTNNSFNWGSKAKITGAFHNFSSKQFKWDTNNNDPLELWFDSDVLGQYADLTPIAGGGAITIDGDALKMVPLGYYLD